MPDELAELITALSVAAQQGAIGERSLSGAVRHSEQFLGAIPATARRLIDLGSGGGLPGLVIAVRRTDLAVTLVERRAARADVLLRLVARLGLGDRVTVLATDAEPLSRSREWEGSVDVVTARSFASPRVTARIARPLLRPAGRLVVAAPPPGDDRWQFAKETWTYVSDQTGVLILTPLGG